MATKLYCVQQLATFIGVFHQQLIFGLVTLVAIGSPYLQISPEYFTTYFSEKLTANRAEENLQCNSLLYIN